MTRGPLERPYSREKYPDLVYASLMLDKHLVGKLKKNKPPSILQLPLWFCDLTPDMFILTATKALQAPWYAHEHPGILRS